MKNREHGTNQEGSMESFINMTVAGKDLYVYQWVKSQLWL